jgi:asparagine synthase (glutamine-hydrolysing)
MIQDRNRPLTTVSMVYDEVIECDERPFINAVLSQNNLRPYYTHPDQVSPLRDMDRVFWHEDGTYGSPTLYLVWELCRSAAGHGVRILLDGLDGDTSVSHGDEYLIDLGRAGKWQEFAIECRALSRVENAPCSDLRLRRYGLPALTELAQRGRWVSFAQGVNHLSQLYGLSRLKLLRDQGLKPLAPVKARLAWRASHGRNRTYRLADRIVNRQFARRIDLDAAIEALQRHRTVIPRTAKEEHFGNVTSGLIPYAFEMSDRAAAAHSLEARHPFYDKRVVEFCLALPPDQKLKQGWNRSIMRRALDGILPVEVQWRGGKTSNSAAFTHSFLNFEGHLINEVVMNGTPVIDEYMDVPALHAAYHHYISHKSRADEMRVWVALTLALWLRHTGLSP